MLLDRSLSSWAKIETSRRALRDRDVPSVLPRVIAVRHIAFALQGRRCNGREIYQKKVLHNQ
jgi:hypothetical protein